MAEREGFHFLALPSAQQQDIGRQGFIVANKTLRQSRRVAFTATARKIAVLFYNALRRGMDYVDPGASYYETRYRERVVKTLHRRAKAFGFVLQVADMPNASGFAAGSADRSDEPS